MEKSLYHLVWQRAESRCEYCRVHQDYDVLTFEVDHVVALKHRGLTHPNNLALACFACNNHKGSNIAGVDSETGTIVRLYHPRSDVWDEHFAWRGAVLAGRTPIGRAT